MVQFYLLLYKKKHKQPPGHATHLKYKVYRNKFNTSNRICKQLYYSEILNEYKNNLKDVWKHLRPIIGKLNNKTNICTEFFIDGVMENNDRNISIGFCKYFTNAGKNLSDKIPSPTKNYQDHLSNRPKESIFPSPTTPTEILGIIARLTNEKNVVLITFHLLC